MSGTSELLGSCSPLSPGTRDTSDDLGTLDGLLGADLVVELRHLERLHERMHAFDEDPRNVTPTHSPASSTRHSLHRRALTESQIKAANLATVLRREELATACVAAERAVAVQLLQVRRYHERKARDAAGALPA